MYGLSLVLHSQLQLTPRAPQAALAKVVIPSTVKPVREAEKAQEVEVQEASHAYTCALRKGAVIGPLDALALLICVYIISSLFLS